MGNLSLIRMAVIWVVLLHGSLSAAKPASFSQNLLHQIERRSSQGKRSYLVFDIDNTLVDTRLRTLAAAKTYAQKHPRYKELARLTLPKVKYNGRQVAQALGYSPKTTEKFQTFWNSFFMNPKNFKYDRPISKTINLLHQAHAAGAEIVYLTGRRQSLKKATLRQLSKLSLPNADRSHVFCKPSRVLRRTTVQFKQRVLESMHKRGFDVLMFMSDSRAEISGVQKATPISCLLVDFPVNPAGSLPQLNKDTVTLAIGKP